MLFGEVLLRSLKYRLSACSISNRGIACVGSYVKLLLTLLHVVRDGLEELFPTSALEERRCDECVIPVIVLGDALVVQVDTRR